MQATELMSTNLVVVPPETPITAVAELLAARGISAVPVIDEQGKPIGVVTEGDLIRRLAEEPRARAARPRVAGRWTRPSPQLGATPAEGQRAPSATR